MSAATIEQRNPEMTVAREWITPEQAQLMLDSMPVNRPVSKGRVSSYLADMRTGNWHPGEGDLQIDWDGNTINGAHRLHAVILLNKPVEFCVKRNVDPATRAVIDTGRKRSVSDELAMRGSGDSNALASIIKLELCREAGTAGGNPAITPTMQLEFAEAYAEELAWATVLSRMSKNAPLRWQGSASGTLALALLMEGWPKAKIYEFFDQVRTGAHLAPDSAAATWRAWLLNHAYPRNGERKARPHFVLALSIKAFTKWANGTPCRAIGWRDSEDFPAIPTPPKP